MKVYKGIGSGSVVGGKAVLVNDAPLKHIVKHSPTGLNWGYGGSGPADLAYSILCDLYGKEYADAYYQRFKWDVIAHLPQGQDWEFTEKDIEAWRKEVEEELKARKHGGA